MINFNSAVSESNKIRTKRKQQSPTSIKIKLIKTVKSLHLI